MVGCAGVAPWPLVALRMKVRRAGWGGLLSSWNISEAGWIVGGGMGSPSIRCW